MPDPSLRIALLLSPLALAACDRRPLVSHDTAPVEDEPSHPCALPDDGVITKEIVLDGGCALSPSTQLVVREGAALRLRPGARLTMASGAAIHVQGVLSVKGSDVEPATITTTVPKVGYEGYAFWGGISVEGEHARLELDHASIDRAGLDRSSMPCEARLGAVRVVSPTAHVSIVSSSIRMSHAQALFVDVPATFDAVEQNVLEGDGEVAMRLPASTLASIGEGNVVHGQKVVPTGEVASSMKWPGFDGPIAPEGDLVITGTPTAPTTLTLARGSIVAMPDEKAIVVQPNAGLVAKGVRFTSARPGVSYGGVWVGLLLRGGLQPTVIEDSVVEATGSLGNADVFAKGRDYDHHPSIETADVPTVRIVRTTFRSIYGWAFESSAGDACGKLAAPESGNTVVQTGTMCREHAASAPTPTISPIDAVKEYVVRLSELEQKLAALKH